MWYFNKQKAVPLGLLRGARKELLFMRKVSDVLRRICALALCLCMMAQYMPMAGFAEEGAEAVAEAAQAPEPGKDTGNTGDTKDSADTGNPEETGNPGDTGNPEDPKDPGDTGDPADPKDTEDTDQAPVNPDPTEEETEGAQAGKTVTAWTWVEPEEEEDRILDPETGEVYLSTTQEEPIAMELLTGALPGAILATVEGTEETLLLGPWTCEGYPAEGAWAGDYTFVTTLPEGYTLAEGVAALEVTVRFEEPEMLWSHEVNNEEELKYALNNYTSVTLATDITIQERITINKENMTLDLNGHTLTYGGPDGGSMYDGGLGVFTLKGRNFTVKNGTITENGGKENYRCFIVASGILTIENVTIQGFSCGKGGGAIYIEARGTCNMVSGKISGNSAWDKGGGVYVRGIFNMHDGTISGNNVSSGSGGGVYVYTSGTFTMDGGIISKNNAQSGGGVYVYQNGSFNMKGGEIRNNQAANGSSGEGGGVYVYGGTFTMDGGTISGNTAIENGGGVYVNKNSFTMGDGTISGNTANAAGGGVYMYSGSFTMTGGSITGNGAGRNGNGVSIESSVSCQLSGKAKIAENTGNGTGNLYINDGNAERSITKLTAGAQLGIYFSRQADMKVATGDQGSFGYLTCENEGYVFTLENANELWLKLNRIKIDTHPTGKQDLKYDRKSHELVDAGTVEEGGTMWYAVGTKQPEKDAFSVNLPSGINAGTYTVWYYAKGFGDKADSEMNSLNVTIEKKPLGVTWDKTILTYDGTRQQPTAKLRGRVDGDQVWLKISNQQTDVGTYTTEGLNLGGWSAGNYFLADDVKGTEFTIQPAPLTITAKPKTITYGGAPDNDGVTYKGFVRGENEYTPNILNGKLDYTYDYQQYDQVGCYTITPGGLTSKNYKIIFVDGPLYVDPKTISIDWGETTNTYDGTPWAPTATAEGMVNGDALTLTVTGQKTDAGEHTATVTEIQGEKAENYKLPDNPTASFTIVKADAKFTPPTPKTGLTYNGETQELINSGSSEHGTFQYWLEGEQPGESIPQAKDAGTHTVHYQLKGDQNHKDGTAGKIDVEIAPKNITDATVTLGDSLTYNGQEQTQNITSVMVDDLEVTYDVTDNTGTNAGSYTMTLTGTGNFTGTKEVPWSIGKKDIADAKITLLPSPIYNGLPQIQGIYSVTVDGVYGEILYTVTGDIGTNAGTYTMTLTGTGNFTGEAFATWEIQAAENEWLEKPSVTNWTYGDEPTIKAGTPRFGTVTVEYFRSGESLGSTVPTDAGSYRAVFKVVEDSNFKDLSETVDFTVSKRALTVTANPKTITYGEKPANDGVTYEGFLNGENEEVLTGTLDFAYDYAQYGNVGGYHITPKGLTSGNYDITFTKGILTVAQKDVTIQGVAVEASKVYDGTANAAITGKGQLSHNFDGENLTFHVGTAAYDDKNAGKDKTVTFTGFRLEGSAAGNYVLTGQPKAVTASITPMSIALSATAKDKVYDGTLTAELGTVTHSDFVAGDNVQLVNGTPSFSSKDKGENNPVTFTPFTLTGPDAGNYALIQPTGVKAHISPRPVTVSGITAQDKTYDGNTQVTFAYEGALLEGNVDGDKLTVTAQGAFENANVGSKQVNITGLTLGGEEQGNYVLAEKGQQTSATAAITANSRYLDLSGLDLGGDAGTVWIDGEKEPINTSGGSHILLPEEAEFLTTYTYTQNGEGNDYPVGMRVYRFHRKDTGVTLEEITEFENLLNYVGCSIRISGKQGIRMITGITQDNKKALTSKAGLSGYTLEEYGTVVMRGVGTPTLANSKSHNFAYKKGKADPIFSRANGMIQYTNVLVGFSLDDCKDTLTLRPYIKLKDMTTGEIVTLYGGCVCRSIYQVAQQNENTYKPGTAGYKYIHKILDYTPTAEQGG